MIIKICIPTYMENWGTLKPLLKKLQKSKVHKFIERTGLCTPYVDVGRNEAVVESNLQYPPISPADAFLFMDTDMIPHEQQIYDLAEHLEKPEVDIISPIYRMNRLTEKAYCVSVDNKVNVTDKTRPTELTKVAWVGMGCCLVKHIVLKAMPKPWFETSWIRYEQNGVKKFKHIQEDQIFCQKANAMKFGVYMDPNIEVYHKRRKKDEFIKIMKL